MPIKPLNASALQTLLDRISFAQDGEIRSIHPLSPTSIEFVFSVQDVARGYDWIDIAFVINGVQDAKLLSDNALKMLSLDEGISIEISSDRAAIGIGDYSGRISEAPLYALGSSLGYEERPFSG